MLNNLKELLQNSQLQEKIKAAADQATAMELLLVAGAERGYVFTVESVTGLLAETNATSNELGEDDLLVVSGGYPSSQRCSYRYCTKAC